MIFFFFSFVFLFFFTLSLSLSPNSSHLVGVEHADELVARDDSDVLWIELRADVVQIRRLTVHLALLALPARDVDELGRVPQGPDPVPLRLVAPVVAQVDGSPAAGGQRRGRGRQHRPLADLELLLVARHEHADVVRQRYLGHLERRRRDSCGQRSRGVVLVDRGLLVQGAEEEVDAVDQDGGRPQDLDDEEEDAVGEDAAEACCFGGERKGRKRGGEREVSFFSPVFAAGSLLCHLSGKQKPRPHLSA